MANRYDNGDLIRLSAAFSVSGTAADPTAVTLKIKDPAKNTDTYTLALGQITKDATGQYHKDVVLDEPGTWWYRWDGTGAVTAAGEDRFLCSRGQF